MDLRERFGTRRPVVGMVHLPPLPGSPGFGGDRDTIRDRAVDDTVALADGGVDAVMVENFGDAPFHPDEVPKHVVASMADLTRAVADAVDRPVGVNVLRNDVPAAVAVAAATGASFVRANVHTGARLTDQGVIEGRAHETMRLRDRLGADIAVLADLDVKHSAPLVAAETAGDQLADTVERGLADAVIVSGAATGDGPALDAVAAVIETRNELGLDCPVFVGSGVTADSVRAYLEVADGAIVGSALKSGDRPADPVDRDRAESLMTAARR